MRIRDAQWGYEEILWEGAELTVKILHVRPNARISYQSHELRDEKWLVLNQGSCLVRIENFHHVAGAGEVFSVPRGTKHRLSGLAQEAVVLEISRGKFDQDDIVRYEDDYGRTAPRAEDGSGNTEIALAFRQ